MTEREIIAQFGLCASHRLDFIERSAGAEVLAVCHDQDRTGAVALERRDSGADLRTAFAATGS